MSIVRIAKHRRGVGLAVSGRRMQSEFVGVGQSVAITRPISRSERDIDGAGGSRWHSFERSRPPSIRWRCRVVGDHERRPVRPNRRCRPTQPRRGDCCKSPRDASSWALRADRSARAMECVRHSDCAGRNPLRLVTRRGTSGARHRGSGDRRRSRDAVRLPWPHPDRRTCRRCFENVSCS